MIKLNIKNMAELKTQKTKASVEGFLNKIEHDRKREEAFVLLDIFKRATGEKPYMWGESIIGFGEYYYESERSSQKGHWFHTGFSPRKAKHSLYVMNYFDGMKELLGKLGKHKTGKCCLYINKLEDVDLEVLEEIVRKDYEDTKQRVSGK
jgi:hypothetical protein